jgi:ABC-2 type transport system permease protein
MNLWRLEWLRLVRTPRAVALCALFVFFGLLEPVTSRYQSQIFRHVGNGVRISFPPATPAAGISSYVSQLSGVGVIVVVVVAAGAFGFDAHPGLATFLRTRVAGIWQLVAPRFAVTAAAAAAADLLGTLAAW